MQDDPNIKNLEKTRQARSSKLVLPLLFVFLLNLFAGLLFINEGLFHYDSVLLAKATEDTYSTGQLQPAVRGRYGAVIVNSIVYFPFFLSGHNADFSTRFTSVLFHALSICILLLLIYELFGNIIHALSGALLLSFTPFYFSPNTYGKEHGLCIFFVLLSFYLLRRGIRKGAPWIIALASLFMAFSISIRESMLAILPLFLLLYLGPRISLRPLGIYFSGDRFRPAYLAGLVIPLCAILSFAYFSYLNVEFHRELVLKDNSSAVFLGPFSYMLKITLKDLLLCIPSILFLFYALGIISMLNKEDNFLPVFLILWSSLILFFGNIETFTVRYLDIAIIPVYIGAAKFISELYARYKIAAYAVLTYFVFGMLIFMYPMLIFRHAYNGEKRYAMFVKEKTEKNAIIIAMDDAAFIEYYGARKTMPHPIDDAGKMRDFALRIKRLLQHDIPVYMIGSSLSYDHKNIFRNIVFTNFDIKTVGMVLAEDYHRPELRLLKYNHELMKMGLKNP